MALATGWAPSAIRQEDWSVMQRVMDTLHQRAVDRKEAREKREAEMEEARQQREIKRIEREMRRGRGF